MSAEDGVEVDRAQVLAHRVRAQGLDRDTDDPADLAVADLGIQDTPSGSAAHSAAARVGAVADVDLDDGRRWTSVWGVRGAPHVHRRGDLVDLAAALWPADGADAAARLAGTGTHLRKVGVDALDALRVTAEAVAQVVDGTRPKGEVSTEVTPLVPPEVVSWCRGCQAHHLSDQILRLATLPAGVRLVPEERTATLEPIPRWPGLPEAQSGLGRLITAYLRVHGPAAPGEVAAYLQTTARAVKAIWPDDDLEELTVDGRRTWVAADALDALLSAPAPRLTRLLPRSDPWLLARDRELLVPDEARRKALWKVLGSPGGLLVDGEVVGTWRVRTSGARIDLTVETFEDLPRRARRDIDDEAERLVALRGADDLRLEVTPI